MTDEADHVIPEDDTTTLVRKYLQLRVREDELKQRGGAVKEEADRLEQQLMEVFAQQSIDRMTMDGHTVYLHSQMWASAKDGQKPELIAALDACGMDHLAQRSLNSNTLSALVREYDNDERPLPAAVEEHVHRTYKYTLRKRRSG